MDWISDPGNKASVITAVVVFPIVLAVGIYHAYRDRTWTRRKVD